MTPQVPAVGGWAMTAQAHSVPFCVHLSGATGPLHTPSLLPGMLFPGGLAPHAPTSFKSLFAFHLTSDALPDPSCQKLQSLS